MKHLGFYTHPSFKDVFIEKCGHNYKKDRVEIEIKWWNKNLPEGPPYFMIKDTLRISLDKWREFKQFTPEGM